MSRIVLRATSLARSARSSPKFMPSSSSSSSSHSSHSASPSPHSSSHTNTDQKKYLSTTHPSRTAGRPGRPLLHSQSQSQSRQPQPQHKSDNAPKQAAEALPAFSLDKLGLSPRMKILVYGILGVLGSIETWFWYQRLFGGRQPQQQHQEQQEQPAQLGRLNEEVDPS